MVFALARNGNAVLDQALLTAASIALIVASILWVVVSRLVLRNLRKGAHVPTGSVKAPPRDLWKEPPEARPR